MLCAKGEIPNNIAPKCSWHARSHSEADHRFLQAEGGAVRSAQNALQKLMEQRLIRRIQGVGEGREAKCSTCYEAEMLGKATMASSLDPEQALMVHKVTTPPFVSTAVG